MVSDITSGSTDSSTLPHQTTDLTTSQILPRTAPPTGSLALTLTPVPASGGTLILPITLAPASTIIIIPTSPGTPAPARSGTRPPPQILTLTTTVPRIAPVYISATILILTPTGTLPSAPPRTPSWTTAATPTETLAPAVALPRNLTTFPPGTLTPTGTRPPAPPRTPSRTTNTAPTGTLARNLTTFPPGILTPTGTQPPTLPQTPSRTTAATPDRTPPYLIIGLSVGTLLLLLGMLYCCRLWVTGRQQRSATALQRPSEIELMSLDRLPHTTL